MTVVEPRDFLIRKGVQKQHVCLDKPDRIMINLLCGSSGFFVSNRRTSNPLFLVIQLGTAKCGAALPHCAWIERLTQVRQPQMVWLVSLKALYLH